MMKYKGYRASVKYDDEAGVFHGEVVDTRDVIFFEATSVEDLNSEFRFSIDDYLAMCAEKGESPDKPFSGRIPLRISPEIHREATANAAAEGKSLNAWLAETIQKAVGGR
jgi:predicted HicB family RNase H-like nuclease